MKICVTSQGDSLDAQIDPRFGRCQYFLIVDTDTLKFESIKNPNIDAMGGAGIQSGQIMAEKSVKAVITGNIGPNAYQTLQAAGIPVVTGASGSVKEAIEKYKKGELKTAQEPTRKTKFRMHGTKI
ncbi:MAG: NifB/NifX family molybdenum-iron cluster-binding protein [Nitrospirae bacterium]|nr:NifB/NifX family molybdenum-iron cluster-binding protein [Nitrospirota bacterium]